MIFISCLPSCRARADESPQLIDEAERVRMKRKPREEPSEPVTSGLSHTEAFIAKITELLKERLNNETYDATLKTIVEHCEDNYDLNRAGVAAAKVAEKHSSKSVTRSLYFKISGDLYRMQCESERDSGRTTIFTGFYNAAMDAYLDGGHIMETIGVAFEHSFWLMRNALLRDEPGKQKYFDLSVKAFDDVIKRAAEKLAAFVHEQQEGRRTAAAALINVQPPAHLASVKDPVQLEAGAQTYRELIAFLGESCGAYDVAASISRELAEVLKTGLPDLSGGFAALAEDLQQRHVAMLEEHGIPSAAR